MSRPIERPEARADTVATFVTWVLQGRVRIPSFQRDAKWKAKDVLDLFDSLYRGFPVGSLLLWKRSAEAARLTMGPLAIQAPERSEAYWVVDGQQRLLGLAAGLARPEPYPTRPIDEYVVYFDAESLRFRQPPGDGKLSSTWVPLPVMLDSSRLSEWVFQWTHGPDSALRQAVFEAGKRLREYSLPFYLLDTENEEWIREVFYRVNNSGRPLEWSEVHDALFGHETSSPSTLSELGEDLGQLGMGRLEDKRLLTPLLASRGLDVTQTLAEHRRRRPDVLEGAVAESLPTLRRVFSFLERDAEIPHLRLLPETWQLDVVTRFFALHPEPEARSRLLLSRWLWRTLFGATRIDERTIRRRGVAGIDDDEEKSVQRLLELVETEPRARTFAIEPFDARKAVSRLAMLAIWSRRPRHLVDGSPIDVAALFESRGAAAFVHLLTQSSDEIGQAAANRTLHSSDGRARCVEALILDRIQRQGPDDKVLASHLVLPEAAAALVDGDSVTFLELRAAELDRELERLGGRKAGWGLSDRPSIHYLLEQLEPAS